jgi:Fe2+ transport system protein B
MLNFAVSKRHSADDTSKLTLTTAKAEERNQKFEQRQEKQRKQGRIEQHENQLRRDEKERQQAESKRTQQQQEQEQQQQTRAAAERSTTSDKGRQHSHTSRLRAYLTLPVLAVGATMALLLVLLQTSRANMQVVADGGDGGQYAKVSAQSNESNDAPGVVSPGVKSGVRLEGGRASAGKLEELAPLGQELGTLGDKDQDQEALEI